MINSRVNHFVQAREHLWETQVLLELASHQFLVHDSYAAFHDVITKFTIDGIILQIEQNTERSGCQISEGLRPNITAVIERSRTISIRHKRLILDSISPAISN